MTKLIDRSIRVVGTDKLNPEQKKHNLVYKMQNTLNGRYYIGVHVTDDVNDGYLGSGKIIRRAILDHGVSAFKKEILFDFPTEKEAYAKERELVTEETILPKNPMSYNVKPGGEGGYPHETGENSTLRIFRYRNPRGYAKLIAKLKERARAMRLGKTGYKRPEHSKIMSGTGNPMFGVNSEDLMSPEAIRLKRQRMREHSKARQNMAAVKADPVKFQAWREKIRSSSIGRKVSDETKLKHSLQSKESRWWNNGSSETFRPTCPDGYVAGRLSKTTLAKSKTSETLKRRFSEVDMVTRKQLRQDQRFWDSVLPVKLPDNWCAIRQLP